MSSADFDDRIALSQERLLQVLEQIRAVLHEDLGKFVAREARKAFLTHPEAADALTDQQVADLKTRTVAASTASADRIAAELADQSLWLEEADASEGSRSLEPLGSVWAIVRSVEADVTALLEPFGLAPDPPAVYKAPAYFVAGRFLPTLAEHYWKLRSEIDELEAARRQEAEESVKSRLAARWDEA